MCTVPDLSRTLSGLVLALAVSLMAAGSAAAGSAPGALDPWQLCSRHISAAERAAALPPHLLAAIAKIESGRWSAEQQAKLAWPWTVMAEGKGRYLPTRAAAIAEVRALKARGIRNIDVGCMQINLRHHPEAFANLDEAFDPARNAAYAARLLGRLRAEHRSWTKAIGLYHSKTPRFNGPYRLKVFRAWREERHRADRARLAARKTAQQSAPGQLAAAPAWDGGRSAPSPAMAVQQRQRLGGIGGPLGPVGGAQAPLVPALRVGAGLE